MLQSGSLVKLFLALGCLAVISGAASAQTFEPTWTVPDGVTICPAGDGGVATVKIQLEAHLGCDVFLVIQHGDWDFNHCDYTIYRQVVVDGVHEGNALYRFDFELEAGVLYWGGGATLRVEEACGQMYDYPGSLKFRSYDLDATAAVNLNDISIFAGGFQAGDPERGDFNWDGIINLSDLPLLAQHNGHTCNLTGAAAPDPEVERHLAEMVADPDHPLWNKNDPVEDSTWSTLKTSFQK